MPIWLYIMKISTKFQVFNKILLYLIVLSIYNKYINSKLEALFKKINSVKCFNNKTLLLLHIWVFI